MRREQVRRDQERSITWSRYFAENRDWLTSQIKALESMDQIKGERRPTLDLTWILGLYRLARDYLDAFDASRTMLHEMKTSVAPLGKRVATLESAISASEVKVPRIPIDWDELKSISRPPRSGESLDHMKNHASKSQNKER
jgi:hypothetical protein